MSVRAPHARQGAHALAAAADGAHASSVARWPQALDSQAEAWRVRVQVLLGPPHGTELRWRRGPLPTINNIDYIKDAHVFDGLDRRALLANNAQPTALESSDPKAHISNFFIHKLK